MPRARRDAGEPALAAIDAIMSQAGNDGAHDDTAVIVFRAAAPSSPTARAGGGADRSAE